MLLSTIVNKKSTYYQIMRKNNSEIVIAEVCSLNSSQISHITELLFEKNIILFVSDLSLSVFAVPKTECLVY